MITLHKLNRREAVRYLGGAHAQMNDNMQALMDSCEAELLEHATPKYLYKIIDLPCEELTPGNDIKRHLDGCHRAVVMCATLGADVDRLLRITQIRDMARAVVLDSMASTAIEQVCQSVDETVAAQLNGCYMTFRFSPGYGDYSIALQKEFLRLLDAPRKIGLGTNDSYMLVPSKSVTAIAGISNSPVAPKKRGCAVCNLRKTCQYRKNGEHCGYENTAE